MRSFVVLLVLALVAGTAMGQNAGEGFGAELGSIDFSAILGGPMEAVIDAQGQAAMQSVEFIQQLGFEPEQPGEPRKLAMVDFVYSTFNPQTNTSTEAKMELPFLLLVPIPYIEMSRMSITFIVQLTSTQETVETTRTSFGKTISGGGGWFSRSRWAAAFSTQSKSNRTGEEKRDYKLVVDVQASQAALPRGMERILDLFEQLTQANLPATS